MPSTRDIPGFYYDDSKNRYFPIPARGDPRHPKICQVPEKRSTVEDEGKPVFDAKLKVLQILLKCELGDSRALKQRFIEMKASRPYLWSYGGTSCADGSIKEFRANIQTNEGLKDAYMIAWGNSNGVLGVCEVIQSDGANFRNTLAKPAQVFPPSGVSIVEDTSYPPDLSPSWSTVARSKITAIRKLETANEGDNDHLIFTTLGSGFEGGALHHLQQRAFDSGWAFEQRSPLESTTSIVTNCSVWTAEYCAPDRATIGTSKGAAIIHLETSRLKWLIRSKSDVLSQECDLQGDLLFCGFRNGYITMMDMRSSSRLPVVMPAMRTRTESSARQADAKVRNKNSMAAAESFADVRQKRRPFRVKEMEVAKNFCETMRMSSAICSLLLLHSDASYLLSSAMNGEINLWDRRLTGRGPVLSYDGNINTCLPLCSGVDPSETLLLSGGEDSSIRIWNLRSGELRQTIHNVPGIVYNFSTPNPNSTPSLIDNHSWRIWLGSSAGVMFIHG